MIFPHDDLMRILGFTGADEYDKLTLRYKCRLMGALYSCHFWRNQAGTWEYIGSYAPATALSSVLDLVGGPASDFEHDEEWARVEGRR